MPDVDARREAPRFLVSALRGRPRLLAELAAWSVVEMLPAFVLGRAVARAIDRGFLAGQPLRGMAWLGLVGVVALLGAAAARQLYPRLAAIIEPFRDALIRRVAGAALARCINGDDPPDTAGVSRLTHQVEICREAFAGVFMIVRSFTVTMIGALAGLVSLVPIVAVLVVPPLLLGLGLFAAVFVAMMGRQREMILADERVAETAGAMAGGLRDVLACGAGQRVGAAVGAHIDARTRAARALARLTALRTAALVLAGWVPVVLILAATPWLVRRGVSTGEVVGALTYVSQSLRPALSSLINGMGNNGLHLAVTMHRLIQATRAPAQPGRTLGAAPPARGHGAGQPAATQGYELDLRGVTFSYGAHAQPVIDDLDMTVPEGSHLAVVGPSGIGKSTLANLVTGMLEPRSGQVRLGGVPLGAIDGGGLARRRVLIPQQAYVFTGTVLANLTYLDPDAPWERIERAVAEVGLDALVDRLGGYAGTVDPAALSAGERQLVCLGRAHLSTAPLMVLDEATCHLDPQAEARAEQALARREGTLLVIAHRVSSALRAGRIAVMDGSQVTVGTHAELLARSELYRDLVGYWEEGTSPRTGQEDGWRPAAPHAASEHDPVKGAASAAPSAPGSRSRRPPRSPRPGEAG